MTKHKTYVGDESVMMRGARHVQRHWWQMGLGAVAAGTIVTLSINAAWGWLERRTASIQDHYLRMETNEVELRQLKAEVSNLTVRVHNQWQTNQIQNDQIRELQYKSERLR